MSSLNKLGIQYAASTLPNSLYKCFSQGQGWLLMRNPNFESSTFGLNRKIHYNNLFFQ